VLVGHSYGGAVRSNAANGNEQVQALVFIAGWMPDEGESIQQLMEAEAFGDSLVPATLEWRRGGHALGPGGVAVHPVVIPGHR
jgi:pimeloyl-ACP methyl ester carboxylesterase